MHIHAKIVAIYVLMMSKMALKPEILLFLSPPVSLDDCLTVIYHFKDPNQLSLDSRWHWYLRILPIHAKARLELQNPQQEY